jgi:hypothetical protein
MTGFFNSCKNLFFGVLYLIGTFAIIGAIVLIYITYLWLLNFTLSDILWFFGKLIGGGVVCWLGLGWLMSLNDRKKDPYPTDVAQFLPVETPPPPIITEAPQSRGGRPRKLTISEIWDLLVAQGVISGEIEKPVYEDSEWEELYKFWKKSGETE